MPTSKKMRPSTTRKPSAPARKLAKAAKPPERAKPRRHATAAKIRPAPKLVAKKSPQAAAPSRSAPKISAAKTSQPKPPAAKASVARVATAKPAQAATAPLASPPASAPAADGASTASTYLLVLSGREKRGRRFVRLKSPSVLAWFQRAWRLAREGRGWAGDLGGEVHGLDALFDAVESRKLPVPPSEAILIPLITKLLRAERELEVEPHFVHVETDDDELEIEYFFFDDVFLDSGEALDRLPSPKRRPAPVDEDEPAVDDDSFAVEDDDDDPYTVLIAELADS